MHQHPLLLPAAPRGLSDITAQVAAVVAQAGVQVGLCHIFLHHTSASLVVQENADPQVLLDLEAWFSRLVQDGDPLFLHTEEGPDDMSAHVKAALTASSLTLPITGGRLALGTWQGIYLWEHRSQARARSITVTVQG